MDYMNTFSFFHPLLLFFWSSLFSHSLYLSLLVSSYSSWLLRGGAGHLVFIQPRRPRGPRGPKPLSGSSDSIDRASIQLCPGFGFWHGPVPREQKLFLFESLNERGFSEKRRKKWSPLITSDTCVQIKTTDVPCNCIFTNEAWGVLSSQLINSFKENVSSCRNKKKKKEFVSSGRQDNVTVYNILVRNLIWIWFIFHSRAPNGV